MVIDKTAETVGARLASVVSQLPDKIAVVEDDTRVTYREFDRVATAIALHVVTVAAGREGCVGLFFDRKLPALESVFGVARSGRPYVPLDAGDPEERLRFILRDCEPVVLLTETPLLARARAVAPAGCVVVDIAQVVATGSTASMATLPEVSPDQTLYLCYTSGSTGQPKGVIQTHRNSLFYSGTYARSLNVEPSDRLSLLFTMSFAAANNDFYGALLNGATLCAYDTRKDGVTQLADWLDRERITILHLVPTVFREMCTRLPPGRILPYLKAIDMTGESTYVSDVEHYRAHMRPECRFVIQFSASEICLIAQNPIGPDSVLPANGIVPVGRSPEGVRVTIRRADGSVADPCEVGNIIVSSANISPGYWRRHELNAQTFADSAEYPGLREYKGGDLGRIDADGNLTFIGRQGGRVKVRGHSVDLMEVEAALSICPGVAKAAVVAEAGEHAGETGRLVAFVVTSAVEHRAPQAIRRYLAAHLPWYMVPSGMVFVDELPMTATGKVDRAALAQLDSTTETLVGDGEPPRDDIERAVAAIFADLMKLTAVSRDDDFFLLGGDSMMGVELQTRLSETFDVHVGGFHDDATVAGIAGTIRHEQATPASARGVLPVLLPLWQQGHRTPMFLIHGRNGQAFVSPHFMRLLGDDQPVWVFQARGLDGVQAPHARVEDMAFHYLAELRKQRPHGPYFIASLCAGALIAAIIARSLRAAGETVLPLLLFDPPDELIRQTSAERLEELTRERREMGHIPDAKGVDLATARRVGMAFDDAISRFRPQPYDGPVFVLSSQQRAYSGDVAALRRMFPGHMDRYIVGTTHRDALDPHNPAFASTLQECLARIRQEMAPGSEPGSTTSVGATA